MFYNNEEKYDVGVIIGRFQVHNLTPGHEKLIKTVIDKHEKTIILLGVSGLTPVPSTRRNPLDFESRKQLILEKFPGDNIIISYVKDMKSDDDWSKQVDNRINDLIAPRQSVVLYGGRDSFIKYYSGKFTVKSIEPDTYYAISGTEYRDKVRLSVKNSSDFRAGVIWANENRFFNAIAVVDIAVFNEEHTKILLGRKPNENKYRFFGGFVDVKLDDSYESAAIRETKEESGINISSPNYVTSIKINDWRYKSESDKIYTVLFECIHISGSIVPSDDIIECKWFDYNSDLEFFLVNEHKPLFNKLKIFITNKVKG